MTSDQLFNRAVWFTTIILLGTIAFSSCGMFMLSVHEHRQAQRNLESMQRTFGGKE